MATFKSYIGAKEIQQIIPVGYRKACNIVNDIQAEMVAEGYELFDSKQKLVPLKRVLKKLGLKERDVI